MQTYNILPARNCLNISQFRFPQSRVWHLYLVSNLWMNRNSWATNHSFLSYLAALFVWNWSCYESCIVHRKLKLPKLSSLMINQDHTAHTKIVTEVGKCICSINSWYLLSHFVLKESLNFSIAMAMAAHSIINIYHHTHRPAREEGSFI